MTDDEAADLERPHRFAYLDPPYFGLCNRYDHNHPAGDRPFDGRCWDDLETHVRLIAWALSLSSTAAIDGWLGRPITTPGSLFTD